MPLCQRHKGRNTPVDDPVYQHHDLVALGFWVKVREVDKLLVEGRVQKELSLTSREHVVKDGNAIVFRFNV